MSPNDLTNLRTILRAPPYNGAIPHEVRGSVWLLLLRLRSDDLLSEDRNLFAQTARHAVTDHNSREQIEKDVERTRPGLARFKQLAVRGALLRLLSLFCDRHQVSYVQGLNELLAPFILLADTGSNPRIAYALFSAFVARFAPWTLETSETRMFEVLKRLFKYFERLLHYHDPELYWLLETHTMTPDLYATSWFITLFSRNFTVESVLALWDLLLLEDNPLGTSFFAIALLQSKRDTLFSIDESSIPETLMLLTASSPAEVRRLWKIGSEMRTQNTPPSFQRLMTDRIVNEADIANRTAITAARHMQRSVCLQTTPEDLVAGDAQYFTWDCRSHAEYNAGHLAQAAFLPLQHVRVMNGDISRDMSQEARAELQHASEMCEQLRGSTHICLIGSGVHDEDKTDINVLALYLTRLGIPYVSTLRGGFEEALEAVRKDESLTSVELVDYDHRKHDYARRLRMFAKKKLDQAGMHNAGSQRGNDGTSFFAGGRARSSDSALGRDETDAASAGGNGLSSFLEKTDAEVSKALAKALNGIGFKYALSSTSSGVSAERDTWSTEGMPGSASSSAKRPNKVLSGREMASPTSSITTSGADTPHRMISAGLRRSDEGSREDMADREAQHSKVIVSGGSKPTPGGDNGTTRKTSARSVDSKGGDVTKHSSGGFFSGPKSPWVRDAKPGWLSDITLKFPLSAMPRGFTVNVMDDKVMQGLRLFPCKARAERTLLRSRSNEFKRRYVGVCNLYLLVLGPVAHRGHLLEVKIIRYLSDIVRITFKRSRPELVTFSILMTAEEDGPVERIVCLMPDGLKECVDLIRKYIADEDRFGDGKTDVRPRVSDGSEAANATAAVDGWGERDRRRTGMGYAEEYEEEEEGEENEDASDEEVENNDMDDFGELQSAPSTPNVEESVNQRR